ncbi:iron ABC transporter permease [Bacillus sp. 03113]|uniref:ABC transporter permease n=1 Tax=Bacillus sp. 03113 TaxID=2578211 RepID=UPI0011444A0E|nr:iron ABC transporter permease [Bacillus sp. 03113]
MEEQYAGRQSHSSSSLFTKWVKGKHLIFGLSFALLSIFFVIPIIRLLLMSFSNEKGFSLSNYEKLLTEKSTWVMLKNTFYIVGGSTLLSLFLGIIMAWIIAYSDIRLKKGLQLLILIPFVIPSYIVTLSWTQLVQKNSFFMKLLSFIPGSIESINMYSLGGMIFVLGISHYPLVFILTTNVLRRIPRELEWAVRSSGGGRWKIFSTVTLPLSFPGIISGGLLAFLSSLDNFGIPAFLGIPANITVLSTAIYQEIVSFGPNSFAYASALSILLGIFALLGIFIQWLFMRKSKQHETTISDQKSRFSFGPYRLLFEVFIWLFVICISIVPILSMVGSSMIKAYGLPFTFENLTLKHYQYVLFEYDKVKGAIFNSVKLSIITMVVCVIAGTIIAYYRVRKNNSLTKIVEILIGIPFALPGMVLALSIIFAWMQPIPGWNPGIYGTIWILLIAYITRFMMLQVRGSMTAMSQVSIDMEEAAHVSGASGFAKWRVIMFPLLLTGVLSGACLVLITTLTELTVSSLLWSSGTETIGLIIFNFEQAGYTTYSTAFSVCIILMMLAVSSCVYLLQKWWMRKVKSI